MESLNRLDALPTMPKKLLNISLNYLVLEIGIVAIDSHCQMVQYFCWKDIQQYREN